MMAAYEKRFRQWFHRNSNLIKKFSINNCIVKRERAVEIDNCERRLPAPYQAVLAPLPQYYYASPINYLDEPQLFKA